MAKKQLSENDKQKKLLITAMKKTINANAPLPILEDILFTPGLATVTDLETVVKVPFNMPGVPKEGVAIPAKMFGNILEMVGWPTVDVDENFGVTITEGKKKIKLMGENPANFPKDPDGNYTHVGTFGEKEMEMLTEALNFVSNDDSRPSMTGIFIGKHIAATDAHRLFWKPIEPINPEFILPARPAKILLSLGGAEWKVFHDGDLHVRFDNEMGVSVYSRVIDARFPDYGVVIPDQKEVAVVLNVTPDILLKEIKNASVFSNKSTNQVTFRLNGDVSISAQDVDFSFEYKNTIEGVDMKFSKKNYKQFEYEHEGEKILVTARGKVGINGKMTVYNLAGSVFGEVDPADLVPVESPVMAIGFNAKFLMEIINKTPEDSPCKIQLWGPTKAAVINDHYLVMPLMLNR